MKTMDRIPYLDDDGNLRAVIESPSGSRHKLKYVPELRTFSVSTTFPAGMSMPFDFGFFPMTKAADGDPLDVLVLMDGPVQAGTVVNVKLLGVIEAEQAEDGQKPFRNDRLIALAEGSTERGELSSLTDLDKGLVGQIESFFETYNRMKGRQFKPLRVRGPRVARKLLDSSAI